MPKPSWGKGFAPINNLRAGYQPVTNLPHETNLQSKWNRALPRILNALAKRSLLIALKTGELTVVNTPLVGDLFFGFPFKR